MTSMELVKNISSLTVEKCLTSSELFALDVAISYISKYSWISISESLPQKEGNYIVCNSDRTIVSNYFDTQKQEFNLYNDEVVAWMEQPEPYNGKESISV